MKTKIKTIILSTVAILSLDSCTKDFVEINTNPNESSSVAPQALLGPAVYRTISANLNRNLRVNNELMQVTVTTNSNLEFHRYVVRATETEYMWRNWYLQLTNIRDMYKSAGEAQQPGFETYQGISRVLDVWVSSMLTDMFGDVPYFESNLGYDQLNTTPVFDQQIDIYRDLFLKLEQANELLNDAPNVQSGTDPIFAGEALKWRKFANALHLRLLLRVSHKAELDPIVKIKQIIESRSSQYPIMESHDDSAILYFTSQEPYQNPYLNARVIDFNLNRGYSEFFINTMQELGDPRLNIWATEASLGVYGGMQSGYPRGTTPETQSTLHAGLMSDARLGNILNYAELQFILAECAVRGFTSQDPAELYNRGIISSMEMWGRTISDEYFQNPRIGFDPDDTAEDLLQKIHVQKYFTLLFTDFQQWHEYRRTKALDLYPGPGLDNQGRMPVRFTYPLITQSVNKTNYDEAAARMGGDNINSRMWWQPEN